MNSPLSIDISKIKKIDLNLDAPVFFEKIAPQIKTNEISSIESAQFTPTKPSLFSTPPRSLQNCFISIVDRVHDTTRDSLNFDKERRETLMDRLIEEQKKRVEKLKESADEAVKKDTWSALQVIASSLSASAMIIAGITIAGSNPVGTVAAGMLITSGVGSLVSLGMHYFGYDQKLTGAIALCSAGIGLAASGTSFFMLANQLPHLVTYILQSTTGVVQGFGMIARERSELLTNRLQAELSLINLRLAQNGQQLQQLEENSNLSASVIEGIETASKAVAEYNNSIKQINLIAAQAV